MFSAFIKFTSCYVSFFSFVCDVAVAAAAAGGVVVVVVFILSMLLFNCFRCRVTHTFIARYCLMFVVCGSGSAVAVVLVQF